MSSTQILSCTYEFELPDGAIVDGEADRRSVRWTDASGETTSEQQCEREFMVLSQGLVEPDFDVDDYVKRVMTGGFFFAEPDTRGLVESSRRFTQSVGPDDFRTIWQTDLATKSVSASVFRQSGTVSDTSELAKHWKSLSIVVLVREDMHVHTVHAYSRENIDDLDTVVSGFLDGFGYRGNLELGQIMRAPWLYGENHCGELATIDTSPRELVNPVDDGNAISTHTYSVIVPKRSENKVHHDNLQLSTATADGAEVELVIDTIPIESEPFDERVFASRQLVVMMKLLDLKNVSGPRIDVTHRGQTQRRRYYLEGEEATDSTSSEPREKYNVGFVFSARDHFHKYHACVTSKGDASTALVEQIVDSMEFHGSVRDLVKAIEDEEATYEMEQNAAREAEELPNKVLEADDPGSITLSDLERVHFNPDHDCFAFRLFMPALDQEISCRLVQKSWRHFDEEFDDDTFTALNQKMLDSLNLILALPSDFRTNLGIAACEHYRMICQMTDLDVEDGPNCSEENPFGIVNWRDVFPRIESGSITVTIQDPAIWGDHRIAAFEFYPEWEQEHGLAIVLRDGVIVGHGDHDFDVSDYLPNDDPGS